MALSKGAKAGIAIAAVGAVGIIGYEIYTHLPTSPPSPPPSCPSGDVAETNGACPSGYVPDPNNPGCCMVSTSCNCPSGEVCETNGACPSGYVVDPNNPGCCMVLTQYALSLSGPSTATVNEPVTFSGSFTDNGVGVPNQTITLNILDTSDGSLSTQSTTTDSSGNYSFIVTFISAGTYDLTSSTEVS
ncbi:MAG: Ig-like domain-containing protein [Thermoplasmatales archaeon]